MKKNSQFSGSNISLVKEHNLQAVLLSLLYEDQISRVELAERTALSSTTITNLTAELLQDGIIRERRNEGSVAGRRVGRPRTMLQLVPDARYVVGVHIGIGLYRVAITNLHAEMLLNIIGTYRLDETPAQVLQAIADSVQQIIAESRVDCEQVLGVGVGASGLVDRKEGVNVLAPRLGWRDVDIGKTLQDSLNLPVSVENNVRAMAIGEAFFRDGKGTNVLALVYGRIGVGAGFVIGGQVLRGSGYGAGEIGHTKMVLEHGALCSCGKRGCLETLICEDVIVSEAESLLPHSLIETPPFSSAANNRPIAQIFAMARAGDQDINTLIETKARYLGFALANLVNLIDPDLIVLAGMLAEGSDLFLPTAREVIRRETLGTLGEKVQVQATRSGWRAGVIGASALALMDFFYQQTEGI